MDKKAQEDKQAKAEEQTLSSTEVQAQTADEASTEKLSSSKNAESKTQKVSTPAASTSVYSSAPIKSTVSHASSWRVRLSILVVFILTVLALGSAYYLYLQLNEQKQNTASLKAQLSQSLVRPKQQILALERSQLQTSGLKQNITQLTQTQTQLRERVSVLAQRNPNHWMAAEADYLVQMAGRKLWLEKDPQTAASLLKAADERIASMKDPALIVLRKALAKDIAAVRMIKGTDIAGTIFSLDEIIASLSTLPTNRNNTLTKPDESAKQLSTSVDDWRTNLAKSWKSVMEEFITIRHRTTDLAPLLEPDQQWYLLENIRNKLLQSQLALYRFDEVNYRQSINLAREWVHQYFDLNSDKTQEALKALDALATVKITTVTLNKFSATAKLRQLNTYGELLEQDEGTAL